MLSGLDWGIILGYFALLAGIGVLCARSNRSYGEYMFAGGRMPWLAVGISLIATSVSSSTFLGNPANTYATDMRLLMLSVGSLLSIGIVGWIFIPRLRAAGIQSAYELLEQRFTPSIRTLAAILYTAHLLMRLGILLYAPSLIIQVFTGLPVVVSIAGMAVVSMIYTYFGGIRAITWTDVMQFCVFMGCGVIVLLYCTHAVGSFSFMWEAASEAGKTRWFDATYDPSSIRNIWSAGLAYIAFEVAIRGCDQQFVQRYLSCASPRDANRSSVLSVLLGVCVGLLFYSVGASLFVFYQQGLGVLPATATSNDVFPYFIMHVLPGGLRGLLVAAILGEALSSLNSAYTALSNTTVIDFLRKSSTSEDGQRLLAAKRWVLLWGVLGAGVAVLCAQGEQTLLDKAIGFTSLFTGPLLAVFLLAFFKPKVPSYLIIISVVGGVLGLLPINRFAFWPSWEPWYAVAPVWNPLIACAVTCLLVLLAAPFAAAKSPKRETFGG
jgi:solute:Na+ symporter, SSS family